MYATLSLESPTFHVEGRHINDEGELVYLIIAVKEKETVLRMTIWHPSPELAARLQALVRTPQKEAA